MGYIKGIDISNNNGAVDFSVAREDGFEYVYLKATEGKTFQDNKMEGFYNEAKMYCLKAGAYHFLVGTSSPEAQAENFYKKIKDFEWKLLPMLDIETEFVNLCDYIVRFIKAFKELSPMQLGIYTYTGFIPKIQAIGDSIKDHPLWEANYNNDPWNLPDNFFINRVGHQYTEKGEVYGVSGKCDLNSFTQGALLENINIEGEWINEKGKWWYKHMDGTYTKSAWEFINGKWYLFDEEGWMIYDCDIYGYRFDSNGGAVKIF